MLPHFDARPRSLITRNAVRSTVHRSLVVIVLGVVDSVEELELVDTLASGDDTKPVTELHLLEELLGTARDEENRN